MISEIARLRIEENWLWSYTPIVCLFFADILVAVCVQYALSNVGEMIGAGNGGCWSFPRYPFNLILCLPPQKAQDGPCGVRERGCQKKNTVFHNPDLSLEELETEIVPREEDGLPWLPKYFMEEISDSHLTLAFLSPFFKSILWINAFLYYAPEYWSCRIRWKYRPLSSIRK